MALKRVVRRPQALAIALSERERTKDPTKVHRVLTEFKNDALYSPGGTGPQVRRKKKTPNSS
mgnify:CR=1 FL=1|jgi:hypothetical protein